jgi:type II restriction enzyme
MSYSKDSLSVSDLIFVPKYFFVPDIIEKRKPLAMTERRAGWIGCNILIDKIPEQGRIPVVSAGTVCDIDCVLHRVKSSEKLEMSDINNRGWLMDILQCVNEIDSNVFTLSSVYFFEDELAKKHPNNKNIRAKIRQQLQYLRNRGVITFLGNGRYQKEPLH